MTAVKTSENSAGKFTYIFLFISLLFCWGIYNHYFNPPAISVYIQRDTDIRRYILIAIMGFSVFLIIRKSAVLLNLISRSKYHFFFIALCFLSSLWSVDPYTTLSWSITIFCIYVFSISVAINLTCDEILTLYLKSGALVIILSILIVFIFPAYGIHQQDEAVQSVHAGSWRGVFDHRTKLGQFSALYGSILILCGSLAFRMKTKLLLGAATLTCLIMSNSGGAISSIVLCLGAGMLARSFYKRDQRFFFTLTIASAMAIILIFGVSLYYFALDLLGKSTDLTGRVPVWSIILNIAGKENWIGYGYVAGFTNLIAPNMIYVYRFIPNSQNIYIDIFIYFGYFGILFLFLFITNEIFRIYNVKNENKNYTFEVSLVMIYVFILQISIFESLILDLYYFLVSTFFMFSIAHAFRFTNAENRFQSNSYNDVTEIRSSSM